MKVFQNRVEKNSLRTNILIFFITSILVCFSVGLYNYILLRGSLQDLSRLMSDSRQLTTISTNIEKIQSDMDAYLSSRSSEALQSFYDSRNQVLNDADTLAQKGDYTDHGIKLKNLRGMLLHHLEVLEDVVIAKRNEKTAEYTSGYQYASESYSLIDSYIQEILAWELQDSARQYETMQDAIRTRTFFSYTLFGASFILVIVMIFLYSYQITKPLANLSRYASKVSEGDYDVEIENDSSDLEFDRLYDAFSVMLKNTRLYLDSLNEKQLLERQLSEEKIKSLEMKASLQEAEYLALRSQMNPHFIFNTINIGARIAMLQGDTIVCEYLEDAADVFRYTLQGLNEATLAEELENVTAYMNLLTTRFGDKLKFHCSVEEHIPTTRLVMPRMTLQPLVENAYVHGVGQCEEGGSIMMEIKSSQTVDEAVEIVIANTGIPFPSEKIEDILSSASLESWSQNAARSGRGLGMINVIRRLSQFFHTDAPLRIETADRPPEAGAVGPEAPTSGAFATQIIITVPPAAANTTAIVEEGNDYEHKNHHC